MSVLASAACYAPPPVFKKDTFATVCVGYVFALEKCVSACFVAVVHI